MRRSHYFAALLTVFATLVNADQPPTGSELVAVEGIRGPDRFFVRYRAAGKEYYSGGTWSRRIDLNLRPDETFPGPYILPLEYHRTEPWIDLPADAFPVRVLPMEYWIALKARLFDAVLPREPQTGIVVSFNRDDYFLFREPDDSIGSLPLRERPEGFRISEILSVADLVASGRPLTEDFLREQGIADRRVVFNTGDIGVYSLPFLYVNLDLGLAVFARVEPERGRKIAEPPVVPVAQTVGHLARSHLTAMAVRPLSSLQRLLFVVGDTVTMPPQPGTTGGLPSGPVPPLARSSGMDLGAWELYLDEFTGRPSSTGTLDYLVDGDEFFPRLIDSIEQAEKSIHMRTYIFDNDDFAALIGELLKERAAAGVDVKVLLDGLGTIISTAEKQKSLPSDYQAPDSVRLFLESKSDVSVRQAPNPWLTGDHVKSTIVDGEVAFVGGMNIAREYRYDWHDMMVEIRGPVIWEIQSEFDDSWIHAGVLGDLGWFLHKLGREPQPLAVAGYPIRLLHTRPAKSEIFEVQREAMRRAQQYIYVENAYFTDDVLLQELIRARYRGVDVRVIVPMVTDRGPLTRDNALAANTMLEHGIRVFIYPGMSHVKAAVFDGWACLGSANFDRLSLKINREMNVATPHAPAVQRLIEEVFQEDFDRSPELLEPFPERWSDHLVEVLGDYIF